jgi:hypothetical protein
LCSARSVYDADIVFGCITDAKYIPFELLRIYTVLIAIV